MNNKGFGVYAYAVMAMTMTVHGVNLVSLFQRAGLVLQHCYIKLYWIHLSFPEYNVDCNDSLIEQECSSCKWLLQIDRYLEW